MYFALLCLALPRFALLSLLRFALLRVKGKGVTCIGFWGSGEEGRDKVSHVTLTVSGCRGVEGWKRCHM